jgi:hypothetical protein
MVNIMKDILLNIGFNKSMKGNWKYKYFHIAMVRIKGLLFRII